MTDENWENLGGLAAMVVARLRAAPEKGRSGEGAASSREGNAQGGHQIAALAGRRGTRKVTVPNGGIRRYAESVRA